MPVPEPENDDHGHAADDHQDPSITAALQEITPTHTPSLSPMGAINEESGEDS